MAAPPPQVGWYAGGTAWMGYWGTHQKVDSFDSLHVAPDSLCGLRQGAITCMGACGRNKCNAPSEVHWKWVRLSKSGANQLGVVLLPKGICVAGGNRVSVQFPVRLHFRQLCNETPMVSYLRSGITPCVPLPGHASNAGGPV